MTLSAFADEPAPRHGYRKGIDTPRPEWQRPFTTIRYVGRHRDYAEVMAEHTAAALDRILYTTSAGERG